MALPVRTEHLGDCDRRKGGPRDVIDDAIVIATVEGVGSAVEYMADARVGRATALRVLSDPKFHRAPQTEALYRVKANLPLLKK